jgi:hypothetical protein
MGEHYYARFHFHVEGDMEERFGRIDLKRHEIDVEYTINAEEAERLNEGDEWNTYKAGDMSFRFLSHDKMMEKAREQWLLAAPHGKVLLSGDMCCCGPVEILEGPDDLKRIGNTLWREWEQSEHDDDYCIALEKQWEALFKQHGFWCTDD